MIRLAETREKLIAVDLDDTFTDHTGAFREVLAQLGINGPDGIRIVSFRCWGLFWPTRHKLCYSGRVHT